MRHRRRGQRICFRCAKRPVDGLLQAQRIAATNVSEALASFAVRIFT
jgi:hypothetical protein